jgi:hypothetical protein
MAEEEEEINLDAEMERDKIVESMSEQDDQPVFSQPQIAKAHLKVSSKISDKELTYIPSKLDKNGKPLEYRAEYKDNYKELLTNDLPKSFLTGKKPNVVEMIDVCCIMIKAFANANNIPLKGIYDSFAEDKASIVNTSRAKDGNSAYLSQSMMVEHRVKKEYGITRKSPEKSPWGIKR